MKVLALCFAMLISSSVFAQTSVCDELQLSSFNKYVDDRIADLDKQIQNGAWTTSDEYKDYDECRLTALLKNIKDYGPASRKYYCDTAKDYCVSTSQEETCVLQKLYFFDCDKPYIPFEVKRSDCSTIFAL